MKEVNDGWEGMTKCPNCGNYNPENNLFCEWCNQRIRWISGKTVTEKGRESSPEESQSSPGDEALPPVKATEDPTDVFDEVDPIEKYVVTCVTCSFGNPLSAEYCENCGRRLLRTGRSVVRDLTDEEDFDEFLKEQRKSKELKKKARARAKRKKIIDKILYASPESVERSARRRAKVKAAGKALVTKVTAPVRGIQKPQKVSNQRLSCWNCRTENPEGAIYCRNCGNLLDPKDKRSIYCSFCGKVNAWNAVYCHECGKKIPRDKDEEWQWTDSGWKYR